MCRQGRRTVVITGNQGGIGKACERIFTNAGWNIHGLDVRAGDDLLDVAGTQQSLESLGEIHAVIHAAGRINGVPHQTPTMEEFKQSILDNLTTGYALFLASEQFMAEGSSITYISSVNGRNGGSSYSGPGYASAKAGLIGLAQHLAKLLHPRRIRVNAIAPGPVETPMLDRLDSADLQDLINSMPYARLIQPEEIAETVLFLASDAAVNINGSVLDVNGGMWIG